MGFLQSIWDQGDLWITWAKDPANSGFAGVVVTLILAAIGWTTGLFSKCLSLLPKRPPKPEPLVHRADHETLTRSKDETISAKNALIETLQTQIRMREEQIAQIQKQDAARHAAEIRALRLEIDALRAQLANPEAAREDRRKIGQGVAEKLDREANTLGADQVAAADAALAEGYFAQAKALFERIKDEDALAVTRTARAEYALGEIAEAEVRWRDALAHFERSAEMAPTVMALKKASEYHLRLGDFPRARDFARRSFDLAMVQGPGATVVGEAANMLALVLMDMGRHAEAEPLYRQAMEIRAKTLGADHPDYAQSLNNLAVLLQATGRYAEAEPLYRQAMEIGAKTVGADHPVYATRLNNLAGLLWATGRHAEAEPLLRQALEIRAKTLVEDHPNYAESLNNLAFLLRATGRYVEAEPLFRQAIAIAEDKLGPDHPRTKTYKANLDDLLSQTTP